MSEHITYKTSGVCSKQIDIIIDPETKTIVDAKFLGGCSGNTQGVCALVKGMQASDAADKLCGIKCGFKSTSCPDQLAKALKEYLEK